MTYTNRSESANSRFITVEEACDILGVSKSKAYKVIRQLNEELKKQNKIVIAGKVSRAFFMERLGI